VPGKTFHSELYWNPELQEWYCKLCGRTSDHIDIEDAQVEVALFPCQLPTAKTLPSRLI
jgi:hypothetical protein